MPSRCFLALASDPAGAVVLGAVRSAFLEHAPGWRDQKWVRAELLHVTVRFIGPIPDADVDALLRDMTAAFVGTGAVRLRPSGVRAVPSSAHASMLWATMEGDLTEVNGIRDRADDVLSRRLLLPDDPRPFTPHITLARARSPRAAPALALDAATAVLDRAGKDQVGFASVPSLTLYASTLGRQGPAYEVLGTVPLLG